MIKSVVTVSHTKCKTYATETAAERAVRTAHLETGEVGSFSLILSRTENGRVLPVIYGMDRRAMEAMRDKGFSMIN